MFKNRFFTFLFSIIFSLTVFIPTVISLTSTNKEDIMSIIDFSGEEEEQKSEVENLELKITFENNTNLVLSTRYSKKAHSFYTLNYSSIDRELHLPPPEHV